jgi:hypothetical protein
MKGVFARPSVIPVCTPAMSSQQQRQQVPHGLPLLVALGAIIGDPGIAPDIIIVLYEPYS